MPQLAKNCVLINNQKLIYNLKLSDFHPVSDLEICNHRKPVSIVVIYKSMV